MSSEDYVVSFSLEMNVEPALANVRRLEAMLYRTLGLIRRLGLPEDVEQQISSLQRLIRLANQLRLAYAALQAARLAAGDPFAWGMAGIAVATFGADIITEMTSH